MQHTAVPCLTASLEDYGLTLVTAKQILQLSKEENGPEHLYGGVILVPLGFACRFQVHVYFEMKAS